jgi:hypothetical protein
MISWGPREAVAASGSSLGGRSPYGVCYVGGSSNGRLSLHSLQDGKRLTQGWQQLLDPCELANTKGGTPFLRRPKAAVAWRDRL